MDSLVVSVTVPRSEEEAWVSYLYDCASVGVEVLNFEAEQVTLRSFFPLESARAAAQILDRVTPGLPPSIRNTVSTEEIPDRDWLQEWRKSLRPFEVGDSFLVVPLVSDPMPAVSPSRTKILIEPGMAFGTGSHESTQLCLRFLERLDLAGKTVLDVGTGAGILAIAAAQRGASAVWACDVDADAVRVARENFEVNHVQKLIHPWTGSVDAVRSATVEICFANLMASIFEDLWPEFERVLRPGGQLVCSGILVEQADAFREQLAVHRFHVEGVEEAGDWIGFCVRKESLR